jgi:hypothetical protein
MCVVLAKVQKLSQVLPLQLAVVVEVLEPKQCVKDLSLFNNSAEIAMVQEQSLETLACKYEYFKIYR